MQVLLLSLILATVSFTNVHVPHSKLKHTMTRNKHILEQNCIQKTGLCSLSVTGCFVSLCVSTRRGIH